MAFLPERCLEFTEQIHEDIRDYLISQDLRRLKTFRCKKISLHAPINKYLADKLTILSTLHNLTHVELELTYSEQFQEVPQVADVIGKMTWLERLQFCYPIPNDDISTYLANHTRLTMLCHTTENKSTRQHPVFTRFG